MKHHSVSNNDAPALILETCKLLKPYDTRYREDVQVN